MKYQQPETQRIIYIIRLINEPEIPLLFPPVTTGQAHLGKGDEMKKSPPFFKRRSRIYPGEDLTQDKNEVSAT